MCDAFNMRLTFNCWLNKTTDEVWSAFLSPFIAGLESNYAMSRFCFSSICPRADLSYLGWGTGTAAVDYGRPAVIHWLYTFNNENMGFVIQN